MGIDRFNLLITDRAVHIRSLELTLVIFQPVHDLIILLILRAGIEEFFVLLVLIDHVEEAFIGAVRTIKHLAFPVKNEFLKI
jgi:hypothetical protein